jgi:hypothetical protein
MWRGGGCIFATIEEKPDFPDNTIPTSSIHLKPKTNVVAPHSVPERREHRALSCAVPRVRGFGGVPVDEVT